MDILNKSLEEIFTTPRLLYTIISIKDKIKDYEEVSKLINSGSFIKEIQKGFIPLPVTKFEIDKNRFEKRELILASTPSKIVQKILATELNYYFKFSDKVYAYREKKGTIKAIKRTKDFLRRYKFIVKADIKSFFDNIDVNILLKKLNPLIKDKRIFKLIALFLHNGALKNHIWIDKTKGIYQGDNLSPILSNFYLDSFDRFLESKGIDFIRYGDDILLFAKNQNQALKYLEIAKENLNNLNLKFNEEKSYISDINRGFDYLGIKFKANKLSIDNQKLQNKISDISQKTKNLSLIDSITKINEHIIGVKNYYLKIINDYSQFTTLQSHINTILIKKIIYSKENKIITNKIKFKNILEKLEFYQELSQKDKSEYIEKLIKKAYEELSLKAPIKEAKKEINRNKQDYLIKNLQASEIILNRFGLFIGLSKGKIVIKEKGKIIKSLPLNYTSRIIIENRGISISSALIFECCKRKIDIDFIEKLKPYAILTYQQSIATNP